MGPGPRPIRRRLITTSAALLALAVAAACSSGGGVAVVDGSPAAAGTAAADTAPGAAPDDTGSAPPAASIAGSERGDPRPGDTSDPANPANPADVAAVADVAALVDGGVTVVADEDAAVDTGSDASPAAGFVLTELQAARLVRRADPLSGWAGELLDHVAPMPASAPPTSVLLASWVANGTSQGAAAARGWMGEQVWADAAAVRFPPAVVALYVADLVDEVRGARTGDVAGVRHQPTADRPAHQRADRRAGAGGQGLRTGGPTSDLGCEAATAFVAATIGALAEALRLGDGPDAAAPPPGSDVAQGWQAALELAGPEIAARAGELTPAIFAAIRTSAAALGVAVAVVTYLQDHRLSMSTQPMSLEFPMAIGADPDVTGTLEVAANSTTRDWSSTLEMCASSAGVELPTLLEPGAEARWELRAGGELLRLDGSTSAMDDQLVARMRFRTAREPEEHRDGSSTFGSAIVDVRVPRADIADFLLLATEIVTDAKDDLLGRLADAGLEAAVSAAYERAIDPVLEQLQWELDRNATTLFTLTAQKSVVVTYHTPPTTTTTTPPTTEPPSTPATTLPEPDDRDAFCAKLLEPDPAADSGDLVTLGRAGIRRMNELLPLAPAELVDDVHAALAAYEIAAAGDWARIAQAMPAAAEALIAMHDYCGVEVPEG